MFDLPTKQKKRQFNLFLIVSNINQEENSGMYLQKIKLKIKMM